MSSTPSNPSLNPQEIRQILDALEKSEWDEAVVTVGDVSISLARNGAHLPGSASPAAQSAPSQSLTPPPAPAAPPVSSTEQAASAPAATQATASSPAADLHAAGRGTPVLSPTVGIFWRSPEPGAQPFVEVGQQVQAGDIVCIVEVMKLMNNVTAPVSGIVTSIAVENASSVQFDQVLLTIDPQGS